MSRPTALVVGVIAGFLVGMLVLYGVTRLQIPPKISTLTGDPSATTKIQVDTPAPDFELESLDGQTVRLKNLAGRVVLINFWATWCAPCQLEMPAFQDRFEKYGGELRILAINDQDTPEAARDFMEDLDLTFDALLDHNGEVHRQYLVRGFPTSFLVDADGILRIQHVGVMTDAQLDEYLQVVGLGE